MDKKALARDLDAYNDHRARRRYCSCLLCFHFPCLLRAADIEEKDWRLREECLARLVVYVESHSEEVEL